MTPLSSTHFATYCAPASMTPVASPCSTNVSQQGAERLAAAQRLHPEPVVLDDRGARRRRPGHAPRRAEHGDEHPGPEHQAGDDRQHEVAEPLVLRERVAQCRAAGAEQQDREGEHDDAGREQPGAGVVVLHELGGQGDVRHLEQAERRRAEHERDEHPHAGGDRPERGRDREGRARRTPAAGWRRAA